MMKPIDWKDIEDVTTVSDSSAHITVSEFDQNTVVKKEKNNNIIRVTRHLLYIGDKKDK